MEMVTIARHLDTTAADLDAARLEAAGFTVLRHSELSAMAEGFPASVGGIRIQVRADQADDARAFLAEPAAEAEDGAETP